MPPAIKTESLYTRRSYARRAIDAVKAGTRTIPRLPRYVISTFRGFSQPLRLLISVLLAIGLVTGSFYIVKRWQVIQNQKAIERAWRDFTKEVSSTLDQAEMMKSLDTVLERSPEDPTARSRKTALETGEADSSDQDMVRIMMQLHNRANRLDDAAREAKKRLAAEPRDYFAHFIVARQEMMKEGWQTKAEEHLVALADPERYIVNASPDLMWTAMPLLRFANKDVSTVRAFMAKRVLVMFRNPGVLKSYEPISQAILVSIYAETFREPTLLPDQSQYWSPAGDVADRAVASGIEKGDIRALNLIGESGQPLAAGLDRMRVAGQITDEQQRTLSVELEERTRAALVGVIAKEPKNSAAHSGLALSYNRSGMNRECAETILAGVNACGDDPKMLEMYGFLKSGPQVYERFAEAAERNPKQPIYWQLAARSALANNRKDLALTALANVRIIDPQHFGVARFQTALLSESGKPQRVLEILKEFTDDFVVKDPMTSRCLAKSLVELGLTERFNKLNEMAVAAASAANQPAMQSAIALGVYDAEPADGPRSAKAAKMSSAVLDRWRLDVTAAKLRAAALVRELELGPRSWDQSKCRDATRALKAAQSLDPNDLTTASCLIQVELRGMNDPAAAFREIDPLRANIDRLTNAQAELLGATYVAMKRPDDAIRVLSAYTILAVEPARDPLKSPEVPAPGRDLPFSAGRMLSAGCMVQLSLAYHALGRSEDARATLARASSLSMTDRERADYISAVTLTRVAR